MPASWVAQDLLRVLSIRFDQVKRQRIALDALAIFFCLGGKLEDQGPFFLENFKRCACASPFSLDPS
jgi:hypothetical protein